MNAPTGQRNRSRAYAAVQGWLTSTLAALAPTHTPDGAAPDHGREHVRHALAQYPGIVGSPVMSSLCRYLNDRANGSPDLKIRLVYTSSTASVTVETDDGLTVRAPLPTAVADFLAWQQGSGVDEDAWWRSPYGLEFGTRAALVGA